MVRRRILGFAIGKMLRQDGWAEKYNPKNQFHVNQYDYSTCKEYVNALKEKWQEYEDPECEFEDYVGVSKYSNYDDYAYDVDVYRTRLEWRDEMDRDCEFEVNPCDFEYKEYYVKALKRAWKKELDPYEAYQDFDNQWIEISTDLEMIQTEGFDCTKMVDPKMVIKKKNNKEDEVQDGLLGHIIPFDLVQETYLKEDKQSLLSKKNRVSEIESSIEEILESLTEDEKQSDYYDEEKNKFDDKLVKSALKNSDLESETKNKLKTYQVLVNEKKILNKEIKKENESLEINSKETIENLSDDEVNNMLVKKWIDPLMDLLQKIPMNIINELIKTLESLSKKYEVTFEDIENDINQTEKELISMIDDLVGNEYDMLGLQELKSLLGGNTNE